jgi:hypothetical protein
MFVEQRLGTERTQPELPSAILITAEKAFLEEKMTMGSSNVAAGSDEKPCQSPQG